MMRIQRFAPVMALAGILFASACIPALASAQPDPIREAEHRQHTKNDWRNLTYAAGAVGVYGLIKHDKTLAVLGLGAGLYSLNRYEQDRKSQNRDRMNRAHFFDRRAFDHNGHHYVRHTVVRGGHKYYQFVADRGPRKHAMRGGPMPMQGHSPMGRHPGDGPQPRNDKRHDRPSDHSRPGEDHRNGPGPDHGRD